VQLFISRQTAVRHARNRVATKAGWSFNVVSRTQKNSDGSVDIGFGVILFGADRLSQGVL
jgi:hypothetical protein